MGVEPGWHSARIERSNTRAEGKYSHAEGSGNEETDEYSKASGDYSHAEGYITTAAGSYSHAEGTSTAEGDYSHAEGYKTTASGTHSHAEGSETIAEGVSSHAEGRVTKAVGNHSHAEGSHTVASADCSHVQGKWNIKDTKKQYAHIVGNGTKDAPSNAQTLDWKGNAWFQGKVTTNGADYAEFFEWADGNPTKEDRVGYLVALAGEKIKLASVGDDIVGVISGTAAVFGDNSGDVWKKKYLTDDFGRIIYDMVEEFDTEIDPETSEEVQISVGIFPQPRINPDFDPNLDYVPREERQEWDKVGMLGKLHVRDDGTCVIGGYGCAGENGVLTHSQERTNIRVMKRINDNIVLVLMK